MFTITAAAAQILSNHSRTYDALMIEAENAIMAATRTAQPMTTEINFTGIDEDTAKRVIDFLESRGFFVRVLRLDINGWRSKLQISWYM